MSKYHASIVLSALGLATGLPSGAALAASPSTPVLAQRAQDFPPFADVSKGFTEVRSTEDGVKPLYRLWVNDKTQSR